MTGFWDKLPIINLTNEADVELRLVEPLLRALGYQDDDIAPKYPVQFQEGRTGRKPEADYVCFAGPLKNRDTSLLVVEAKKPGESLPPGKSQGESYAANLRAPVLVLTNGETFEIWQLQPTGKRPCSQHSRHVPAGRARPGRTASRQSGVGCILQVTCV